MSKIDRADQTLTFREFSERDIPRLVELLNCEDISRWTSNIPHPYTVDDAQAWLQNIQEKKARFPFAIILDKTIIGCISYWYQAERVCEIGYWIGKDYWRRGYASQAVALFIRSEHFPECDKILGHCKLGNLGSEKVLLNNDFHFIGHGEINSRGQQVKVRQFEKRLS